MILTPMPMVGDAGSVAGVKFAKRTKQERAVKVLDAARLTIAVHHFLDSSFVSVTDTRHIVKGHTLRGRFNQQDAD